ncbi:hypothetical protein AB0D97_21110 [Streptomyces roseus]|uniref:hypothetical protein n=1 Tax=Streptomyces roseus TaxID=66430 RepID=UPI0033CDB9F0
MLSDSVIVRGTVSADQSVEVTPAAAAGPGAGAAVITKLPVVVGQQLKNGQLLLEVSGRPVIALKGKVPVYRDLKPGAEGDDVTQLQEALTGLGHSSLGDRKGYFGAHTKAALSALYKAVGYDPLPAQEDSGSLLEAAQASETSAARALEDAKDGLRGSGGTPGSPDKDAGTSKGHDQARQVQRADEDLRKARERLTKVQETTGPMLPAAEVVHLTSFPARVDKLSAKVGAPVTGALMTVSAGPLVVNGYLQQHQKGMVRPGQKVLILSELTGKSAEAAVVSVSDSPGTEQSGQSGTPAEVQGRQGQSQGTGSGGPMRYAVIVKPTQELDPTLAGQDVRLTVQSAATQAEALVVPFSAVSAGADGKTSVTVLQQDGSRRRVAVTTGTTGDGYVEVRPADGERLVPGDRAIVGVRTAPPRAGTEKP